jgi:hypothetical protein
MVFDSLDLVTALTYLITDTAKSQNNHIQQNATSVFKVTITNITTITTIAAAAAYELPCS